MDGKLDVVEIPSNSQTALQMKNKVNKMNQILGDRAGNGSVNSIRK